MSKSIMQTRQECFICKTPYNLHRHHIFEGTGRRKTSEKYGCWIWLCGTHHTGYKGIHFHKDVDLKVKQLCQQKFEETIGTRSEFMILFGRSYL